MDNVSQQLNKMYDDIWSFSDILIRKCLMLYLQSFVDIKKNYLGFILEIWQRRVEWKMQPICIMGNVGSSSLYAKQMYTKYFVSGPYFWSFNESSLSSTVFLRSVFAIQQQKIEDTNKNSPDILWYKWTAGHSRCHSPLRSSIFLLYKSLKIESIV